MLQKENITDFRSVSSLKSENSAVTLSPLAPAEALADYGAFPDPLRSGAKRGAKDKQKALTLSVSLPARKSRRVGSRLHHLIGVQTIESHPQAVDKMPAKTVIRKRCNSYSYDFDFAEREAIKIADCGKSAILVIHKDCGARIWIKNRCKSRFCPDCSRIKSARVVERWLPAIAALRFPVVFTVTQGRRCSDSELPAAVENLLSGFEKLRRSKVWRGGAGIWSLEIINKNGFWHPHLHVIVDWRFTDFKALAKRWREITGALHQPDIKKIEGENIYKALREVLKYVTKVWELDPGQRQILMALLGNRKVVNPFGKLKAAKIERKKPVCPRCGEPFKFGSLWEIKVVSLEYLKKERLTGCYWADFYAGWEFLEKKG